MTVDDNVKADDCGNSAPYRSARIFCSEKSMPVPVTRLPIQLMPDPRRVITRLFVPGEENRVRDIINRLLAIPEDQVETSLTNLEASFQLLHPNIDDVFLKHFDVVKHHIPSTADVRSEEHTSELQS